MEVSAWSNGGGTYGIQVGFANQRAYFDPAVRQITVELDGVPHAFTLTDGFWAACPEFRDSGSKVIADWLLNHGKRPWPTSKPPKFTLDVLGAGKYRLLP